MVVQFMDKFEVFNRLTVNHTAIAESALEHLVRRLAAIGTQPPEAQESMPQKES